MGIISNWKAGREARIAEAKARGTMGYNQSKAVAIDAGLKIAGKLADPVMSILEKYGVADSNDRVHCTSKIFNSTSRHFRDIHKAGTPARHILQVWTDELKGILGAYGIVDTDKQDAFIFEYMDEIEKVS